MEITELSRSDAERLRNALPADVATGLKEAFVDEERNLERGRPWALSESERMYFAVSRDGAAYLFIGINPSPPNAINISSFARIVPAPKGHAGMCLKAFIETKLVPMCRETQKEAIAAHATARGQGVFERLKLSPPRGIKTIQSRGPIWTLFLAERAPSDPDPGSSGAWR